MTKFNVFVCCNGETVTDACDGGLDLGPWHDEIGQAFADAAVKVFDDRAGVEVETDGYFPNWHGGKYTTTSVAGKPWGYSAAGLVYCIDERVPRVLQALCDKAQAAGEAAAKAHIAGLEADRAGAAEEEDDEEVA